MLAVKIVKEERYMAQGIVQQESSQQRNVDTGEV